MNSEEPTIATFPSDMIPITCESYSASSKWCVVRIKHRSGFLTDLMISQIPCLDLGSSPEEGSSKKITLFLPIRALASETFLLFPPERFLINLPF